MAIKCNKPFILRCLLIFFAEFFGTFILLLLGCTSLIGGIATSCQGLTAAILAFGFAVMIAIHLIVHVSGGHINPAVTLMAVILGHVKYYLFPIYFFAQILGAIAGFYIVKLVEHEMIFSSSFEEKNLCLNLPNKLVEPWQAMAAEFMITALLCLLCGGIWDPVNFPRYLDSVVYRIGLAITGLAAAGVPYSSASMNPARSFAPALIHNIWDHHWVYWVGPLCGSAFAGLLYRFCLSSTSPLMKLAALPNSPNNQETVA